MTPKTWLLRRLAELVVFVVAVSAVSAAQLGTVTPILDTTGLFVLCWALTYAVFSGYLIISAILFVTFRRSADPRLSPTVDSLAFLVHSYGAVSVIYGWPIGFGAGLDVRSPPVLGWCAVLALHALLLAHARLGRPAASSPGMSRR
jgi:hypothetical protein